VAFGEYGLKAVGRARMTAREIEAARRAISRYVKRERTDLDPGVPGRADHPEAARSAHGFGKGNVEYWVAKVLPGKCCSRSRA